jgi:putative two-component system hydrogenase maturation factor HypX/HoxX
MKVMLLCSSFNGLSQRVWLDLRAAGVEVAVHVGGEAAAMRAAVADHDPDLVICPYLRHRVPAEVWRFWRTIIIHPGPVGDRGASSLDWAIMDGVRSWGVTALQAVEELDAGPVWASLAFRLPASTPSKSSLYNGPVADAAVALVREVVAHAHNPSFQPRAVDPADPGVPGRLRPTMRQSERAFSWADPTEHIVTRVRAADGSPGVHTRLLGRSVAVFDAHPGPDLAEPDLAEGAPGSVVARRHGGLLVRTGDGTVWVGQLKAADAPPGQAIKLPAGMVMSRDVADVPHLQRTVGQTDRTGFREITYQRHGRVGVLSFDFYNGAMSTDDCRRLAAAVRRAAARDTRVLLIHGGRRTFSNGIHLNVIDAAADPRAEAWSNINAIDDVCLEIIACTSQLVVTAVAGNAGAGGVMLALGADRVLLREGVVVNPHYATMGLYGSEYWTYVLPRRVGDGPAHDLTAQCLPLDAHQALGMGLADGVLEGPAAGAEQAALTYAQSLAASDDYREQLRLKRSRRARDERRRPLDTYRLQELAEMSRDIFDDRNGFAVTRRAFVTKQRSPRTTTATRPRRTWTTGTPSLASGSGPC